MKIIENTPDVLTIEHNGLITKASFSNGVVVIEQANAAGKQMNWLIDGEIAAVSEWLAAVVARQASEGIEAESNG